MKRVSALFKGQPACKQKFNLAGVQHIGEEQSTPVWEHLRKGSVFDVLFDFH